MSTTTERRPTEETSPRPAFPEALLSSTGFLLAMVGAESRKRWVEGLSRWDLRPSHFAVMMALGETGAISQQDLARLVGVDPRNLVAIIDLLEGRNLVERGRHPADRRRHAVQLTPAGRQLLRALQQSGAALEEEMLAALDEFERTALRELLVKLLPGASSRGT